MGILTMAKLDQQQQRKRQKSIKQSAKELAAVFSNSDGLRRLLNISNEEWQQAADSDAAKGQTTDGA